VSGSPASRAVKRSPTDVSTSGRRGYLASLGAVVAAFLASLCCVGPLVFITLGVGAGLASRFEPLRPVLTVLTLGLLALGFYTVYGTNLAVEPGQSAAPCGPEDVCIVPRNRTREKVLLWAATVVALLLLTFPQWSRLLV
jgi:mercuric ion transport protein